MNKKKSVGVTVFAIIGFIFSGLQAFVASLLYISTTLKEMINNHFMLSRFGATMTQILIISFLMFFVSLGLMASAIYILKLKDWARKSFLYLNTMLFFLSATLNPRLAKFTTNVIPELFIMSIYYLVFIYFFTRPKVKGQFETDGASIFFKNRNTQIGK